MISFRFKSSWDEFQLEQEYKKNVSDLQILLTEIIYMHLEYLFSHHFTKSIVCATHFGLKNNYFGQYRSI